MTDLVTPSLVLHPIGVAEALRIVDGTPGPSDRWHPEYPFADELRPLGRLLQRGTAEPHFGLFQVRDRASGLAIGGIGFHAPPDADGEVGVGYGLVESARGAGSAAEALRALAGFAARHGARRLMAETEWTNIASQRTMLAAGLAQLPYPELFRASIELPSLDAFASLGPGTDLMVLAASGSRIERIDGGWTVGTPDNPGFRWGNALVLDEPPSAAALDGLAAIAAERFPGARHLAIAVDAPNAVVRDAAAIAASGCTIEHEVVLTAGEPPHVRAAGPDVSIRRLDGDADWSAATALWREDRGEEPAEAFDPYVVRRAAARRRIVEAGRGTWFGAFDGSVLVASVGIVAVGVGVARYQHVGTRAAYRRRGLASALVAACGEHAAREWGSTTLVILADPDGDAVRLYRRLGFVERERVVQIERAAAPAD